MGYRFIPHSGRRFLEESLTLALPGNTESGDTARGRALEVVKGTKWEGG
jgi:hypothetical protein